MSVKKYYLDKRTLKSPTADGSLANLQNVLDLKDYIESVVDDSTTDFTSINVDTINESTAAHGVIVDGVTLKDGLVEAGNGTNSLPSITFASDLNTGLYRIGADNLGITAGGSSVAQVSPTLFLLTVGTELQTNTINETTTAAGVLVDSVLNRDGVVATKPTPIAINATATATAAQLSSGVITSTSAAAVDLTLPSVASLVSLMGISTGSTFDFVVDNSAGANTVTVTLPASITAPAGAVTGGNTLTVTTTHKVGLFRLYLTSPTAAVIYRIG